MRIDGIDVIIDLMIYFCLIIGYVCFVLRPKNGASKKIYEFPDFDIFPQWGFLDKLQWMKYGIVLFLWPFVKQKTNHKENGEEDKGEEGNKEIEGNNSSVKARILTFINTVGVVISQKAVFVFNICLIIILVVATMNNTITNLLDAIKIEVIVLGLEFVLIYIVFMLAKFEVDVFLEFFLLLAIGIESIAIGRLTIPMKESRSIFWLIGVSCALAIIRVIYLLNKILGEKVYVMSSKIATMIIILLIQYTLLTAMVDAHLKIEGTCAYGYKIKSLISEIYYVVMTFSTIGFGDISPITDMGKLIAILISLDSIICLVIFAGSFTPTRQEKESNG